MSKFLSTFWCNKNPVLTMLKRTSSQGSYHLILLALGESQNLVFNIFLLWFFSLEFFTVLRLNSWSRAFCLMGGNVRFFDNDPILCGYWKIWLVCTLRCISLNWKLSTKKYLYLYNINKPYFPYITVQ